MPGRPRPLARSLRTAALALTLVGCVGQIGGEDAGGSSRQSGSGASGSGASGSGAASGVGENLTFVCDEQARPAAAELRRLTMAQYRNTVADLVAWALGDAASAEALLSELDGELEALPEDRREPVPEDLHGSYRRLDQSVQQVHVDAIYELAVAAGAALTSPERLATVVGECAVDADADNDATCLSDFVERFGARALRRPLESDERSFYESVYGEDQTADPAAYADVIAVLLNAPQFLYFVEHGASEVEGKPGVFELATHELASRLSYQLWQTAPDDQLLAAAGDGSLLTPEGYAAEVARLIADPRAQPAMREFFGDWVKVDDLPALEAKASDPVFQAFAGADLPGPGLRQSMIEDVLGLFDWYTWSEPSGLAALLSTEQSFARGQDLATIYGVEPWDGVSSPPAFPAGQRPGFLTRALFLATGSANTRPIMKGVFIRKYILCDEIPPPPPGANAEPPELEPGMTTRETVQAITEAPGSLCAGCHATVINPLGFATENFDALGRYRDEQRLFDAEGNDLGSKAVDTSVVPEVVLGDRTPASGAAELMTLIRDSGKVEACLARNYFRFTHARWEDLAADGCALENLRQSLLGGTMVDLIGAAVLGSEFRQRAFE